jgi:hypothetical protein
MTASQDSACCYILFLGKHPVTFFNLYILMSNYPDCSMSPAMSVPKLKHIEILFYL